MIKIFDVSNSDERPDHRNGGGPLENDVMRYLRENAEKYDCKFVDFNRGADILITNDVFPKMYKKSKKPKLKRMDGIFFQEEYLERNIPLNNAALEADHVIFISEFSNKSYLAVYDDALKSSSVILNTVDPKFFVKKYSYYSPKKQTFLAIASDWKRPEKRLIDVMNFAMLTNSTIYLIGRAPNDVKFPSQIISCNYLDINTEAGMYQINNYSKYCDAFLNLSYRDAAPKTVCQGLCYSLPVLYANSGGVSELVGEHGIGIKDEVKSLIENSIPQLDRKEMISAFKLFKSQFKDLSNKMHEYNKEKLFKDMLDSYFFQIKRLVGEE